MEVFTVTFGNVEDKVNSSLIPLQVIFRVKKPSEEWPQPPKAWDGELRELRRVFIQPAALLPAQPKPLAWDQDAKCRLFL